jgi:hypothetical protein
MEDSAFMEQESEQLDHDNPEWTRTDFADAMTCSELPESLRRKLSDSECEFQPVSYP